MAYVAAGRLSGFWEIGLNSWDLAAGALLIQESGGVVGDTLGQPYHLGVRNVVASNGLIQKELAAALQAAGAAQ
ncbi:Inositol-1-monophosphatase [compost metagenome]